MNEQDRQEIRQSIKRALAQFANRLARSNLFGNEIQRNILRAEAKRLNPGPLGRLAMIDQHEPKASNYTLVGGNTQGFLLALALVGRDAWSCFHTKHGDWAISLVDEAELPRPQDLPEGVEVFEYGEMTFSFKDMLGVCPGLKDTMIAAGAEVED